MGISIKECFQHIQEIALRHNYKNARKPYDRPGQADALLQIDPGLLATLATRQEKGWPEKALNP